MHKGTNKPAKCKEKSIFFVNYLVVLMKMYTFAGEKITKVTQIVNNPIKLIAY